MNLASRNYHEKRSFIRMKVDTPVDIALQPDLAVQGICHNLSGGGMLISLSEAIELGAEVEITVSSNHGHSPMLRARARVLRVQEQEASRDRRVGLEIVAMMD